MSGGPLVEPTSWQRVGPHSARNARASNRCEAHLSHRTIDGGQRNLVTRVAATRFVRRRRSDRRRRRSPVRGALDCLANLAIHGDADQIVPVIATRSIVSAIRQAGGRPIYTELQNVGHGGSWKYAYALDNDVLPWVFSQRQSWLAWDYDSLAIIIVIVDALVLLWFIVHVIAKSKGRLSAMLKRQASSSSAAAPSHPLPPSTAS
jgi:hypothetical protein